MEKINVKVKKLNKNAIIPTYGSEFSAGADIYACIETEKEIAPHETLFIPTGLAFEFPAGYVMLVFARSGLGCKQGLAPSNKVAVIDSDYRGELMIALHNHSSETRKISPKDKIAQFVIVPYLKSEFIETDTLSDTSRGSGGFGSTGK